MALDELTGRAVAEAEVQQLDLLLECSAFDSEILATQGKP